MSGSGAALGAALCTIVAIATIDACLSYIAWGVVLGMHDVEWVPWFPLELVVALAAGALALRLRKIHRRAVNAAALVCGVLSVPYLGLMLFFGLWGCSDSAGCRHI